MSSVIDPAIWKQFDAEIEKAKMLADNVETKSTSILIVSMVTLMTGLAEFNQSMPQLEVVAKDNPDMQEDMLRYFKEVNELSSFTDIIRREVDRRIPCSPG